MARSTLTPCDRARGRLRQDRELEVRAKRAHTAAQHRLEQARAKDVHPRQELVDERDACSRLLAKRRAQAAAAERAVKRACAARPSPRPSSRAKALGWLAAHNGITESPAGSNSDERADGIRAAQLRLANGGHWLEGAAWCGTWAASALLAAGVVGVTARLASVGYIEDDAKAHRRPFRGWTTNPSKVLRGDLVVLFGYGVHVETVERVDLVAGVVHTYGGNTSSGNAGSQSNGGGAFKRIRSLRDVRGFALVDYPG